MNYSDKERTPNEKLGLILDYFLQYPKDYIRPITIIKDIGVKHTQKRTFYKYCQILKGFSIIDSNNENSYIPDGKDTQFILTQNKDVEFGIPNDSKKRLLYAQSIVMLLTGFKVDTVTDERVLPAVRTSIYSMIISLGSGLTRESLISSKLYNYFKLSKGSLLTILILLKKYKLFISIEIQIKDTKLSIENTAIKDIFLNKKEEIILKLKNSEITLNSISNIQNIKILSNNFPQSNQAMPRLNKKDIIQHIQSHPKYNKMKEEYTKLTDVKYTESEECISLSFDDFINNMLNRSLLDRINLYLRPVR